MNAELLNIFLADDDTDDCIFFEKALAMGTQHFKLTVTRNGEELMDLLTHTATNLPHVLFLDLNMPRKNGFECLTEIRLNKELQDLPVIVFSTSYEREVVNQLRLAGAQYYIRKPSDFDHFASIILHALTLIKKKDGAQPSLHNFVIQEVE